VSPFGRKALRKAGEFYAEHAELIDRNRVHTLDFDSGVASQRRYTRAKVIDMIFFVAGRPVETCFEFVAHRHLRHAADRREGVDMGGEPIGKPFRPARFRIGVVGCSEHGDEDMGGTLSIRYLIEHRHRVAERWRVVRHVQRGTVVVRPLEQGWQPQRVVVIEFPSADALRRWHESEVKQEN